MAENEKLNPDADLRGQCGPSEPSFESVELCVKREFVTQSRTISAYGSRCLVFGRAKVSFGMRARGRFQSL
jgi:hypothetical protein